MKITLNADDMQKGIPMTQGWYKANIVEAVAKQSKDKQSINYVATLEVTHFADTGAQLAEPRKIDHNFNSKAIGFIKPFLAAIANKPLAQFVEENKAGLEFEFEALKGSKLQVKIGPQTGDDGKIYDNKALEFMPYDYKVPF